MPPWHMRHCSHARAITNLEPIEDAVLSLCARLSKGERRRARVCVLKDTPAPAVPRSGLATLSRRQPSMQHTCRHDAGAVQHESRRQRASEGIHRPVRASTAAAHLYSGSHTTMISPTSGMRANVCKLYVAIGWPKSSRYCFGMGAYGITECPVTLGICSQQVETATGLCERCAYPHPFAHSSC